VNIATPTTRLLNHTVTPPLSITIQQGSKGLAWPALDEVAGDSGAQLKVMLLPLDSGAGCAAGAPHSRHVAALPAASGGLHHPLGGTRRRRSVATHCRCHRTGPPSHCTRHCRMGFLPSYPSMVIYGSMAGTAGFIFTFSFFGICSTFYRDSSPLQPPTRALGAALALLAPLAALLASLVYLAESNHLGVTADVTPGGCKAEIGKHWRWSL
jgi:hypothetical protein